MPLDWQSIVVTIVALGAALVIVRRFVPSRRSTSSRPGAPSARVGCESCETGAKATRETGGNGATGRTQTTPVVSVSDLRRSAKRH